LELFLLHLLMRLIHHCYVSTTILPSAIIILANKLNVALIVRLLRKYRANNVETILLNRRSPVEEPLNHCIVSHVSDFDSHPIERSRIEHCVLPNLRYRTAQDGLVCSEGKHTIGRDTDNVLGTNSERDIGKCIWIIPLCIDS